MTVDRIKFSKEFFVLGAPEWCTMEAQLDQYIDDPIECIKELKQKMISMYGGNGYSKVSHKYGELTQEDNPPIINRSYERMEVLIGNCTSLEQLAEHKEFVNKNPDLMTIYMDKVKILTNPNKGKA